MSKRCLRPRIGYCSSLAQHSTSSNREYDLQSCKIQKIQQQYYNRNRNNGACVYGNKFQLFYYNQILFIEMSRRYEHQHEEKTVSTTPSVKQQHQKPVHTYHRYQTLLHYFTSFMTDFKFLIVQLKELVYSMVQVDMERLKMELDECYDQNCQYCEVQFMMKSCKKARTDISKILGLLRGYCSAHNEEKREIPPFILYESNKWEKDMKQGSSKRFRQRNKSKEVNEQILNKSNQCSGYDQDGFLTFRQKLEDQKDKLANLYLVNRFVIPQQINQNSYSENSIINITKKAQNSESQKNPLQQQNLNLAGQFKKAYKLIKLIRGQVLNRSKKKAKNRKENTEKQTFLSQNEF